MLYALFTVPTASDMFTTVGTWSSELFDNLYPLALVVIGLIAGALILRALTKGGLNAVKNFTGRGRSGGGRRRR